jgi:hypothetical protein
MATNGTRPMDQGMETLSVECLRCGDRRYVHRHGLRATATAGECTRCGYLGWAASDELTEAVRRTVRERPVEARRLGLIRLVSAANH